MANVAIKWDEATIAEWNRMQSIIPQSNILQSFAYAQTMVLYKGAITRFGEIYYNQDKIGSVQVLQQHYTPYFKRISLERGPLWFTPVNLEMMDGFYYEFTKAFPKKWNHYISLMPETTNAPHNINLLNMHGFRQKLPGYQSIWLNLEDDAKKIRKNFRSNFRNQLNKAEDNDLELIVDLPLTSLSFLLEQYKITKNQQQYNGPSPKLINSLCQFVKESNDATLLHATYKQDIIGSILILTHGLSATYMIGVTHQLGRQYAAHNFLLWQAILHLQAKGIKWFDLGGIDPKGAKGLTHFKQGMRGQHYQLAGLFR